MIHLNPQNATIGTVVVEVLADDEDFGLNAVVKYKFKQLQNNHWRTFNIDENTGVVTLRLPLDRETQKVCFDLCKVYFCRSFI